MSRLPGSLGCYSLMVCIAALIFSGSGAHAASAQDRLVFLNGKSISGKVQGMDAEEQVTVVTAKGKKQAVSLQGLRRIQRAGKPVAQADVALVYLIDGSVLTVKDLTAAEDHVTISWHYGKSWRIPFDVIGGLRLRRASKGSSVPAVKVFEQGLESKEAKEDTLFAGAGEKVQAINGGLQSIDAERVTFVWNENARKISLKKVYGLTFARMKEAPGKVGRCLVTMSDGSRIWGKVSGLTKGKLALKLAGEMELTLPWKEVISLEIRSDRLVYLSDLKPKKVDQQSWVTFKGPWRSDRSVLGNALTLGSKTFDKGLGVHARCLMTFACADGFDVFAATIGIDAETKGKGDCIFKVLGDGKELFKKRIRGTDKPEQVRVKVKGVSEIVLVVEPGNDLDLADHADWCDARFLKSEK